MDLKHTVTDLTMKTANVVHKGLLTVSGGRVGGSIANMPVVKLHVNGRTSGKRRTVMLTAPVHDEHQTILVASKGGDDRDPQWYLNLVANPEVELTIDGTTTPMLARTATDDEKAELWPQIVENADNYAGYQTKTDRQIPVVICTPR